MEKNSVVKEMFPVHVHSQCVQINSQNPVLLVESLTGSALLTDCPTVDTDLAPLTGGGAALLQPVEQGGAVGPLLPLPVLPASQQCCLPLPGQSPQAAHGVREEDLDHAVSSLCGHPWKQVLQAGALHHPLHPPGSHICQGLSVHKFLQTHHPNHLERRKGSMILSYSFGGAGSYLVTFQRLEGERCGLWDCRDLLAECPEQRLIALNFNHLGT